MHTKRVITAGLMIACTTVLRAQEVYIDSLDGNGQLTVTAPSNSDFTVEWASSLTPSPEWHKNWMDLKNIHRTNETMTVNVPMFYRVTCWTNGLFLRMPVGRTFTLGISNALGQTWTEELSVVAKATFPVMTNDYQLLVFSEQWDGEIPEGANEDAGMVLVRSTGATSYSLDPMNMQEEEGWRLAAVGTAWTNIDEYGERVVTTIEAIESVTVPAGTFTDCLKFHNVSLDASDPDPMWDEWIKPGFFMVKWIDYWGGGTHNPRVHELQSWRDD